MTPTPDASKRPQAEPTPTPTPRARDNNAAWDAADAKDDERHPPVAPKDESPLDSLGKSISEVVTGTSPTTKAPPGRG